MTCPSSRSPASPARPDDRFTGIVPARSIWGLMGRSGLASGAADLTTQLSSGQPLDLDRLLKSLLRQLFQGATPNFCPGNTVEGNIP
ncbi:hypothetical protein [Microtetraspora malaysiensis]|uniref:hypothetical protein n=1 Tax=Microtetraspora malaysiensis TaxID=161358 RepID=UPI003D89D915